MLLIRKVLLKNILLIIFNARLSVLRRNIALQQTIKKALVAVFTSQQHKVRVECMTAEEP